MNKKICFFNSTKPWGGGEKWHFDMASRLHFAKFDVIIFVSNKGELLTKVKQKNIPHEKINITNLSFLNIFKIIKLVRLFKKYNISHIIINHPADLKCAGLAAKIAGIKNRIYRRGSAIPIKNSLSNILIFKFIVTKILCNSNETKKTILKNNPKLFPESKISIIYNGVELEKYNPHETKSLSISKPIILGNVGRLEEQKAQHYLISLAAILAEEKIDFQIQIAGDGRLRDILEKQVENLQLKDNVVFKGFITDIPDFMRQIDIFLLSSRWEGFGYVLVEAMLCSKPVVAFNISSNPEIVIDSETGYLIPPFDISFFAKKTIELITQPILREKFGKAGYNRAKELFDIENTVKNFIQFINSD